MEHIREVIEHSQKLTRLLSNTVKNTEEEAPDESGWGDLPYRPNPHCKVCKGVGKFYSRDDGGKLIYSKFVSCVAPGCLEESFQAYLQGDSQLATKGISSKKQTFETFDRQVKGVKEAFNSFYELAHGKTDLPFLLVYGTTGNGKTHLCQSTTVVLNKRGISTRLYTVADLMAELKESIPNNTTEAEIKLLKECPGLMLDDLGVEYGSMWELSKLEEIIDARYRERLITVLTTNRDLDQISERIVSRFSDPDLGTVVLNKGEDYRRVK